MVERKNIGQVGAAGQLARWGRVVRGGQMKPGGDPVVKVGEGRWAGMGRLVGTCTARNLPKGHTCVQSKECAPNHVEYEKLEQNV